MIEYTCNIPKETAVAESRHWTPIVAERKTKLPKKFGVRKPLSQQLGGRTHDVLPLPLTI
jgi:hypothetical protein